MHGCSQGVYTWKAWAAVEKCFLKFSIIADLSVVTVFPSLSALGSWEEVVLFSIDFTVAQNFMVFVLQDAKFVLGKPRLAFSNCLCILVPNFPESCISRGLYECKMPQDVFVLVKGSQGWGESRAISVPGSTFFVWGMLI